MPGPLDRLARSILFRLDPETAHRLAIRALALGLVPPAPRPDPGLAVRVLGLDLPTPIGLAAGFDKNAEAFGGLLRLGYGFVEVGTVTPRPQPGNPKPRMFRLEADLAIVNRLGFNNDGATAVRERLRARVAGDGVVGVNLGANRDSADRVADYVAGIAAFTAVADYLVMNVSSPNTPGLRGLQEGAALANLLARTVAARNAAAASGKRTPLLLKLAPDLDDPQLEAIVAEVVRAGIDGLIVSNTTLSRTGLRDARGAAEAGGLSGRPLFRGSTVMLAKVRTLVGPALPIIGVGGVDSAEAAWAKLAAGANLVQVYTGMIYQGQGLPAAINRDLAARLRAGGLRSVADIVGTETERWAKEAV